MYLLIFTLILIAIYFFLSWDRYARVSATDKKLIEETIRRSNSNVRGRYLGKIFSSPPHISDIEYENEMFGDEKIN